MRYVLREDKLVKLVTKIYWVDIVAFEVGEHDDEKDHRKQQPSSHEYREKE